MASSSSSRAANNDGGDRHLEQDSSEGGAVMNEDDPDGYIGRRSGPYDSNAYLDEGDEDLNDDDTDATMEDENEVADLDGDDGGTDTDVDFARRAAERTARATLTLADMNDSSTDDGATISSSEHIDSDDARSDDSLSEDDDDGSDDGNDDDDDGSDGGNDDGNDDGNDALNEWQQRVFQRPAEGLRHLALFASNDGTFDHLVVLNLQQNALTDLSPLLVTAHTLRVLDASRNDLAQLPSASFWRSFVQLRLCFLAHNRLQHWRDADGLEACSSALLWLTLQGNPVMTLANARAFVVNRLPQLRALDDFVVTDCEYMRTSGASVRFAAMAPSMDVTSLAMPLEFADDSVALAYVQDTESRIQCIHAANSPSIILQRVVRGFISRCLRLPRLARICVLVVRLQARVRGFLFRRMLVRSFAAVVAAVGQQHLLIVTSTDSPLLPPTARRGLAKLVTYVRAWQRKFHAKKQTVAIAKIRFWCQMAFQRYVHKARRLLRGEHEVCVYYTPAFESEVLALAERAAHRDPYLMAMTPDARTQFIRARCTHSGVSVLRAPHESTSALPVDSRLVQVQRPQSRLPTARKAVVTVPANMTAIVRVFPSDVAREHELLVAEKRFLMGDLAHIKQLQREHQAAVADASTGLKNGINTGNDTGGIERSDRGDSSDDRRHHVLPRAVLVHLAQLATELAKRLVICNKKILAACVHQQQQSHTTRMRFTVARVAIRARGHAPTRSERRRAANLQDQRHGTSYTKMRVLIPWSIDMYLQILALLDRHFGSSSDGPHNTGTFALSYEQTHKLNATIAIQSAWRAFKQPTHRYAREAALARARLCLQRWWRYRSGLHRRLAFVRASVLLAASVTSRTLFMDASVYYAVASATSWIAVRAVLRPCKEQRLHCCLVDGRVEVALSPSALLLRSHSQSSVHDLDLLQNGSTSTGSHSSSTAQLRAASAQRCSAYLPVWLPGTPAHREVSMSARDEDATSLLLVDGVAVEPTLLERELMLFTPTTRNHDDSQAAEVGASDTTDSVHHDLITRFAVGRHVAETSARVVALAQRLAGTNKHVWAVQPTGAAIGTTTSIVRLTFASVDEARRRALVLLSKTFNPVTRSFAQLYGVEALVGAALRHHQWALAQVATLDEIERVLADSAKWLCTDLSSPWWRYVQRKLSATALAAIAKAVAAAASSVPPLSLPLQPTRPDSASTYKRERASAREYHRAASSPSSTMIPRRPGSSSGKSAVPLHVVVPSVANDSEQSLPSMPVQAASSSSSRHQQLTDRVGRAVYDSLNGKRAAQREEREVAVRDLREERERAMEALVIDRRMLQRERAAEVAGARLAVDVQLQRLQYVREIERLAVRDLVERERLATSRRALTQRFEQTFAAQTGAMMRRAARVSVAQQHATRDATRDDRAASLQQHSGEARTRRQDAKSYWFVRNQRVKAAVSHTHVAGAEQSDEAAHVRRVQLRERIEGDKEIKAMLRLM